MYDIPTSLKIVVYLVVFLYGSVIGSFVNVCICRLPRKESIVKIRSHCENCGYQLKWYDLVPIFSYVFLGGKCRKCKTRISPQHLVLEVLNGGLYVLIFCVCGIGVEALLFCLAGSALLILSFIDWKTYEIPVGCNIFIGFLGIIRATLDYRDFLLYIIGFLSVSVFLYILYICTKGRAIGGGDIKLMAACGLLLGWKLIILAFLIGCVVGAVVHLIRMKISGEGRVLAMGPYLSVGVMVAALWGDRFLNWYLGTLGL
ncbi:MAG: prepilin peptidase [Lachnospiraceae bacterium]|nr:prepilin peptidase [Lachnospiraceae bacterium]